MAESGTPWCQITAIHNPGSFSYHITPASAKTIPELFYSDVFRETLSLACCFLILSVESAALSTSPSQFVFFPDPFNEAELLLFQKKGNDGWKLVRYTRVYNVKGAPGMVTFEWFENEGR